LFVIIIRVAATQHHQCNAPVVDEAILAILG